MANIETLSSDLDSLSIAQVIECGVDTIKDQITNNNRSLSIISQNIRSINCNMHNFTTLLQESETPWDVIILSECWLPSTKYIPQLDNYSFAMTTKNKTQNEGVVIYYNKSLDLSPKLKTLTVYY